MNDYQEVDFCFGISDDENEYRNDDNTREENISHCDFIDNLEDQDNEEKQEEKEQEEINTHVSMDNQEINGNMEDSLKKDSEAENLPIEDFITKNTPNLCDLILQNINHKYISKFKAKSGTYSDYQYQFSPEREVKGNSESSQNNTPIQEVISTNDSYVNKSLKSAAVYPSQEIRTFRYTKYKSSGNIRKDVLNSKEEEIAVAVVNDASEEKLSDNASCNSMNNSLTGVQKKVPILLNNLHTMYDLNSERVKKRSEQMKRRKVRFEADESPVKENLELKELVEVKPNKIKLSAHKRFKEEEAEIEEKSEESHDKYSSLNDLNVKSSAEQEDEPEVVISDLECEIDEIPEATPINSNNKSFIPLQNHLRSKRAVRDDKATPSYLMALHQYEESDSSQNSLNSSQDKNYEEGDIHNMLNAAYKHNYQVSDVIEEETSENNTDSELPRKRSSKFSYKRNSKDSCSYFNSPQINSQRHSKVSSMTSNSISNAAWNINKNIYKSSEMRYGSDITSRSKINIDNYGSKDNNPHYSSVNKPHRSKKIKMHKNSKSEYINFQIDMKKILDNIENKRLSEQEERLEKMKLRKKIILNKFIKSNSLHNLPYNFQMSNGSNSSGSTINQKKLSICIPTNSDVLNVFKRLSPSGTCRALYYDFEGMDVSKDRSKKTSNINSENNYIMFNEEDEEVIQNKSIIEINKDEDINFESELNNQLEKNEIIDNINIEFNENNDLLQNDMFNFTMTPNDSKFNTAEKEKPKRCIFVSEDMRISKGGKFDVVQEVPKTLFEGNLEISSNVFNNTFNNANSYSNFNNNKSINLTSSLEHLPKKLNFEITPALSFQIFREENELRCNSGMSNNNNNKTVYNNNYINNNINNISISIVSNDTKINKKRLTRQKNNSITHDIRQIYKGHIKSPSLYNSNPNSKNILEVKTRSNSVNKHQVNVNIANSVKRNIFKQSGINGTSGIHTPRKTKFSSGKDFKGDLKQYLTYSDTKKNELVLFNDSQLPSNLSYFINSIRLNSDSSVNNLLNSSNKQIIIEAMKFIKFQVSSLDHQKFSLDRLNKSKAKFFCLLITSDNNQNLEFKGLYEMNIEKNNLLKLYSVNYYPTNIEFSEVKYFYHFDSELEVFRQLHDIRKFCPDIHAFHMQYNYKKFFKG